MGSCLSTSDNPSRRRSPAPAPAPPSPRKKQRTSLSSSARMETEEEQRLRGIPGRTFLNGGTGAASLFTQQGKKGTNQDAMIVWEVWYVLSNEEVVAIVASAPTRSYAARSLVESAVRSWRLKYPTSKIDDCAVVCLFLKSGGASINTTYSSAKMSGDEDLESTGAGSGKKQDLSSSSVLTRQALSDLL